MKIDINLKYFIKATYIIFKHRRERGIKLEYKESLYIKNNTKIFILCNNKFTFLNYFPYDSKTNWYDYNIKEHLDINERIKTTTNIFKNILKDFDSYSIFY